VAKPAKQAYKSIAWQHAVLFLSRAMMARRLDQKAWQGSNGMI